MQGQAQRLIGLGRGYGRGRQRKSPALAFTRTLGLRIEVSVLLTYLVGRSADCNGGHEKRRHIPTHTNRGIIETWRSIPGILHRKPDPTGNIQLPTGCRFSSAWFSVSRVWLNLYHRVS